MLWDEDEKDKDKVYSFSEYFDQSFLENAKRVKYNGESLFKLIDKDILACELPVFGQLRNNVDPVNTLDDLLEIVRQVDEQDYNTIQKYKKETTFSLRYKNVFAFEFEGGCIVNRVFMPGRGYRYRSFDTKSYSDFVGVDGKIYLNYPKSKAKIDVDRINLSQIENVSATATGTKKTINDLYFALKKKVVRYVEKEIKKSYVNSNYCLRAIRFSDVYIKRILVPVYFIHCKKPGFDIKCYIDANKKIRI